jgi:selenocysteine lyase/cysteine desulfurase
LNTPAFRLDLQPDDVVATTAVEQHANLLPWRRHARLGSSTSMLVGPSPRIR